MKKIFVYSLISVAVTLFSLSYVNYALLSDSSIDASNIVVKKSLSKIQMGYLPKGYSNFSFNKSYTYGAFCGNDMLYLVDMKDNSISTSIEASFVKDAAFIDDNHIMFVSSSNNGIELKALNINTKSIYNLGELSYRYFSNLSNVRLVDGVIYFDIEYIKDGNKGFRSYRYMNNSIKAIKSNVQHKNYVNCNGNDIYCNYDDKLYINDSLFTYNNSSSYELLGMDDNNIVYILDKKTNKNIISLSVHGNIDILENIDIGNISYNKIVCTDKLYLVGHDFILNVASQEKIELDSIVNIVFINKNYIYYDDNGILIKEIFK